MSTIKVDSVKSSVAGVAPVIRDLNDVEIVQGCTAWVSFDALQGGTLIVKDSFNMSSITDVGVGNYTIVFATPMNNANYTMAGMTTNASTGFSQTVEKSTGQTTTSVGVSTKRSTTGAFYEFGIVSVAFFGGK